MREINNLVSIIIPCFNYGHYVLEALKSVKEQSFSNWECIIINDGSTDNSRQIIELFIQGDKRFELLNIPNSGVSNARNIGIKKSSGTYIFPLDADNKICPNCLEKLMLCFTQNSNLKLAYSEAELFGAETGLWNLAPFDYLTMLRYNMIDNSCLFLREDFDRVGGYRINMTKGLEDWDFLIALLSPYAKNQVIKINEPLYYYRVNNNSRRMSLDSDNFKLMVDNILYNNYQVYQKFYSNIFESIQKYNYYNIMMNKRFIKHVVFFYNKMHRVKQIIRKFSLYFFTT